MHNSGEDTPRMRTVDLDGCSVTLAIPEQKATAGVILLHDRSENWHNVERSNSVGHTGSERAGEPESVRSYLRRLIVDAGLACCTINADAGWWLDAPTPAFHPTRTPVAWLLESLLPGLIEKTGIAPPNWALCGTGSGGQGAINVAYRHARRFPVVATIGPDIDFHQWYGQGSTLDQQFSSREAARQQTATLHLHPLNWPLHQLVLCDPADPIAFEGTDRLLSKLRSTGIPVESDLQTRRAPESPSYAHQMAITVVEFLRARLDRVASAL